MARNRRISRHCVTTAEGLKSALAPQQILRAHPASAALGLFFFAGVELLGRRLGILFPRRRDGRRRVGVLRPRPLPSGGPPACEGRVPSAGIAVVGSLPGCGRGRCRGRWSGIARVASADGRAGGGAGLPARGCRAAQFAQPRLDFALLPRRRRRRRRGPVGPLRVTRGRVVDPGGRIVHDIADRVLGHRQPRGLRLVGLRACGGDPRRARAGRGVGPRRCRDSRRRPRP